MIMIVIIITPPMILPIMIYIVLVGSPGGFGDDRGVFGDEPGCDDTDGASEGVDSELEAGVDVLKGGGEGTVTYKKLVGPISHKYGRLLKQGTVDHLYPSYGSDTAHI